MVGSVAVKASVGSNLIDTKPCQYFFRKGHFLCSYIREDEKIVYNRCAYCYVVENLQNSCNVEQGEGKVVYSYNFKSYEFNSMQHLVLIRKMIAIIGSLGK